MVLVLEYLHNLGIVYRDLKPENIMIQENGHIMLVDFDLSTKLSPTPPNSVTQKPPDSVMRNRFFPFKRYFNSGIAPFDSSYQAIINSEQDESGYGNKSNSFVGTEEYVAPEVISGKGHDFSVDWWSMGIVLHEMLYATTPFRGSNRKETFYRILTKSPELMGEPTPLRNLIRKLLQKDPKQRITLEGIKGHDYFKGIDWELILLIQRPPYIPAQIESEGREGMKRIDVELFVQGIFANGGRRNLAKQQDTPNPNPSNKVSKNNTWLKPQNIRPSEPNPFSMF